MAVAAISLAFWPNLGAASADHDREIKLLVVSIIALVANQVTRIKIGTLEIEKAVQDLRTSVRNLERDVGPGSKQAVAPAATISSTVDVPRSEDPPDADDPNRGRFGGRPEANGRRLSATLEQIAGPSSSLCRVRIRVESTDPARPLRGQVRFYLHPTFGKWTTYTIKARGGAAEDEFTAYGAFTIGAEADDGATRLELDLLDVPGGTSRFYAE